MKATLGLEHKSMEELLSKLVRLTNQTKNTFTEKDIAVFQHVNSIEITSNNAQEEVQNLSSDNRKIMDAIRGIIRGNRPQTGPAVQGIPDSVYGGVCQILRHV